MKKYALMMLLLYSLLQASTANVIAQVQIVVMNALKLERKNEIVAVPWDEVKKHIPQANPKSISLTHLQSGGTLVFQAVDENNDGVVDVFLFLDDFKAGETKSYLLKQGARERAEGKSRTDARFMMPREDLAWENDRIAFRMYGPALAAEVNNGIDVWCKRVRSLVIEQWYKDDESKVRSYHEDHGEGADFFSVGRTLGGGSSALWNGDSLSQPGVFESYTILATGPLRAMFELTFKPVQYNGKPVREVRRITLDAGQNLNRIDIVYSGEPNALTFAAGVVKRKGTTSTVNNTNQWISLYGLTTEQEVNGYLGTGAVLSGASFREIREDDTHVLILGTATTGKPVTYYSGGGWTRSGDFNNQMDWERYLDEYAVRLKAPLLVRVSEEEQ
ncbi:MAG TPA: DUF4861 family protein [Bacteroidota bacterium]